MKYWLLILFIFKIISSLNACRCESKLPLDSSTINNYPFIAHIKVESIYKSKQTQFYNNKLFHEIKFKVITQFKGQFQNHILVSGGNYEYGIEGNMCDLGIDPGEEWIVFAFSDEKNNLRVDHCTHTVLYKNIEGERDWQFENGIWQLKLLNEYFGKTECNWDILDGTHYLKYANGKIEEEANYNKGILNGRRLRYYASGQTMTSDFFINGRQTGKSIWYNEIGQIIRDYNYKDNHLVGTCYEFSSKHEIELKNQKKNYYVRKEMIYNDKGKLVSEKEFNSDGALRSTLNVDYSNNESIKTILYDEGKIHYMGVDDTLHNEKSAKQWTKEGLLEEEWIYYSNDSEKYREYKKWDKHGNLINHYFLDKNGIKTDTMPESRH